MYLLNCFFIYSILGYILEITFALIMGYKPESGILYGPWTPIYGIASIIILIISKKCFNTMHLPRWLETIITIIILTIILTLLELIAGNLIELIFGFSFWDYTNRPCHIGKYICLPFSLIWGVLSVIFIYILHPIMNKIIKKIPKKITIILTILFILDLIIRVYMELTE